MALKNRELVIVSEASRGKYPKGRLFWYNKPYKPQWCAPSRHDNRIQTSTQLVWPVSKLSSTGIGYGAYQELKKEYVLC